MVGLIFSSIVSGLVVSRTGHYKWLTVGSIVLMGFATLLMTQLTSTTAIPIVWFWMFLAGLGVGPTFAVFTIIVQNAVPFHELGVATSNLTFFRQIGGSVALAIVGTIFGTTFAEQIGPQMTASGVPPQVVAGFGQAAANGQVDFNQLTGTGDLGAMIVKAFPDLAPFIDGIVAGIHSAFSLAVAQTFWIGVIGAAIAAVAAALMIELPLRQANSEPAGATATSGAGTAAAPEAALATGASTTD
jgi:MFS family permease